MQENIPIVVTKKKNKKSDLIFKIPTPELADKLNILRNPNVGKPRNSNLQPRHQTLDVENLPTRTRRISSSAASKRFPKDFFKDENSINNPIKSNRPYHKQYQLDFFDTFSKKNIITMQCDDHQQKQVQEQDTPKFKCKKGQQLSTKQKLLQYIKNKRVQDNTPTRGKYNTCPEVEPKLPLGLFNKQQNQLETASGISSFNVTLGQKQPLVNMMEKQKKVRKKKQILQKENNNYLIPLICQQSKKETIQRIQGFRIRKKVLS